MPCGRSPWRRPDSRAGPWSAPGAIPTRFDVQGEHFEILDIQIVGTTPPRKATAFQLERNRPGVRGARLSCARRTLWVAPGRLLARECDRLFPDEAFADLFDDVRRRSIPPRIVSVVMVLRRIEGLSDREAVERFTFDVRWKHAAGELDFEHQGFVHTVLVDMRARLRASEPPARTFEAVLEVANGAGLVGRRRVRRSGCPTATSCQRLCIKRSRSWRRWLARTRSSVRAAFSGARAG